MNDDTSKCVPGVFLDCDRGRAMGCASFCCALIVRLAEGERDPTVPYNELKHCIDKDPETGRCIHQDPGSGTCRIWEQRPQVCRAYDCNQDVCLQTVLRMGFRSLMQLVLAEHDEGSTRRRVPYRDD